MKKEQLRREFWLLLLIAGVAYLWWQSSTPSRYGELPGSKQPSTPLPYPDAATNPSDSNSLAAVSTDTLVYADSASAVRVRVIRMQTGDSCVSTIAWTEGDSVLSECHTVSAIGYEPRRLKLERAGESFQITVDSSFLRAERGPHEPRIVDWPAEKGLLFEDLLLLQMPYWRGHIGDLKTSMAVLTDRGLPLGMLSVRVEFSGDTDIEIHSDTGPTARLEFVAGSAWVHRFRTPAGHNLQLIEHHGRTR